MDEKKKLEIQKEAQEILKKFGKMLERVPSVNIKRESVHAWREEAQIENDKDLKKRILANAPDKDGDCIVAEKASW